MAETKYHAFNVHNGGISNDEYSVPNGAFYD